MTVADRVQAASARLPLSALSPAASRELAVVLARAGSFEDLPGKWQAALLEAEAERPAGAAPARRCCGAHAS
jgi:hypothetical protein